MSVSLLIYKELDASLLKVDLLVWLCVHPSFLAQKSKITLGKS
jgi:hypothetical protein